MLSRARVAAAFSLRTNLQTLFVPRPGAVRAITGLRALSMFWVLVQHLHQGLRPLGATPSGAMFLAHPFLSLGWAGNLGIEMFFVISGYLVTGMLMRERATNGTIQMRLYYVRRALRILPAYLVAIALYLALPSTVNKETAWTNILFVNNLVPFTKQFMAHCWSLAIEEQFFLVAPLFVLLLYRAPRPLRTPVLVLTIVTACAIAVAVVLGQDLELSLRFPSHQRLFAYMDAFYTKPHTRYGSLAIGALVAKLEDDGACRDVLARRTWLAPLLVGFGLACMAYAIRVFPEGRGPAGEKLLFGSFALALDGYVFAAGIGMLLLVSRTRHWLGRVLEAVLGARVLHVFAQLSFAMYLLHPVCITPLYGWLGFDLERPWSSYARLVACGVVVSSAAGAVLYLAVELPLMRLRPRPSRPALIP